ncbi:MAG: ABC transporter substrate-binding protein [Bacteroidetes bacterium]|nr:ABC transporter substrate-binding protein [Bacteroidota bacterium]MBK9518555.1 ABC transporter substrate-binding protein [Anaeromyxobacter sp.]MBL0275418.1 ABC transporter substrate-binding protein [Anaeromyxobacter sp.]
MALSGDFKETSFADLLQLYAISRQTAAVRVHGVGSAEDPDGLFHFADGNLVGAELNGLQGREAIRAALRITEGRFSVDAGARPTRPFPPEQLRHVVMEEVVKMDEEQHASRTGETPLRKASPPAPPPPSRGGAARQPGAAPPSGGRAGGPGAPGRPLLILGVVATALLLAAVGWFAFARQAAAPPRPAPAQAAQPAVETPAVRGVTATEIVLGMAASFTGSNKERGRAMKAGWSAALGAANLAGGIHGRTLRLVSVDDAYDPALTGPAMKQLVEGDKVFAVVGNVGTATAKVSIPYCTEQKVIFFGALSGADLLRKTPPDRYVFNYRASLGEEGAAAVRYLVDVKRIPADRIAVLVQKDDFGESGWRGAVRQLETYAVPAAAVPRLEYARNTADVREALDALRAKAAVVQAVVLVATYKPAATFIRKARDLGLALTFVTVSADSNGLAQELVESGVRYTEGVVVTQVVPVPTSKASGIMRYRQAMEQHAPGEPLGSSTLEAWIGAQLFLEGLKRAGPQLDTERLVTALEALSGFDIGSGAAMSFSPKDHQASKKVWGWALQPDGSYQQIDLE